MDFDSMQLLKTHKKINKKDLEKIVMCVCVCVCVFVCVCVCVCLFVGGEG